MKAVVLTVVVYCLVVTVVLVLVKNTWKGNRAASSYTGTYIRFSEHESGKEWDTLVIKAQTNDLYRITRKWNYERVVEGQTMEPEYKKLSSTGIYLPKEGLLVEEETGLRYRLEGKRKSLLVGETRYQKLK